MSDEISFEFVNGYRRNSVLLYAVDEKQLYRQINVYHHGKRYVCYQKKCNVSVFLDRNNKCRRLKENIEHTHPTQELTVDKMRIARIIRDKCRNNALKDQSIREIFEGVVQENGNVAHMANYEKMRRQLFRIRSEVKMEDTIAAEDVMNAFEHAAENSMIINDSTLEDETEINYDEKTFGIQNSLLDCSEIDCQDPVALPIDKSSNKVKIVHAQSLAQQRFIKKDLDGFIAEEEQMRNLLLSWNLEILYPVFLKEKITVSRLQIIQQHHIEKLFRNIDVGSQISFEYCLQQWRDSVQRSDVNDNYTGAGNNHGFSSTSVSSQLNDSNEQITLR